MRANLQLSVFDIVIVSVRQALFSDGGTKASSNPEGIERGITLTDVLSRLLAVQSKDHWVRFSQPLVPSTSVEEETKTKGEDDVHGEGITAKAILLRVPDSFATDSRDETLRRSLPEI
jgi:hypothetical protein